jgi:hypothetical protein
MKTIRALMLIVSLGLALALPAQTVEFIVLDRQVNYVQTSAGTAALTAPTPYEFMVDLNGQGLVYPPFTLTFKKPGDSITDYTGYETEPGRTWQAPMSVGQFASMAGLQSAFPGGTYTIQTNLGNTTALSIPNLIGSANDGMPDTPFLTGTQNGNPVTWSGGKMLVDSTQELTLTSNVFATNYTLPTGRIGVWISGNSFNQEATNETTLNSFVFTADTVQMQILANTLNAGVYSGALEFNNVTSGGLVDLSNPYGAGAVGAAVYTAFTTFQIQTIQAIPEPSTYAAIFGAMALAGAASYRRRRMS